jgi:hypothetical protein
MKYIIRSVKYFFYFAILTTLIILALVFIGAVEGNIESIFEDGYSSLWKIAVFFVLAASVYPKFGFIRKRLDTSADWDSVKEKTISYFQEKPFKKEAQTADSISFRRRDIVSRITKMGEDRITLIKTDEGYYMEGLRKDVILYSTGLESALSIFAASDSAE